MVRRTTEPENPGSAREPWQHATARIDWLAGPIDELGPFDQNAQCWLNKPQPCKPEAGFARANYTNWIGDRNGSKIGRALDRRGRVDRTYLVLKGTGLTYLRDQGDDDQEILHRFARWHGQAARIDLAVDVRHRQITPRAFKELHEKHQIVTRLRQPWFGGDPAAGETFYLKGKSLIFRVYDKTAERRRRNVQLSDGITRIELEMRGEWARRASAKLLQIPHDNWATDFPATVLSIILSKVRPLNAARPDHNPNRAPLWHPLVEAVGDLAPVRLPRDEIQRDAEQRIAGAAANLRNQRRTMALIRELTGHAHFAELVERMALHEDDRELVELMQRDPDRLKNILLRFNFEVEARHAAQN